MSPASPLDESALEKLRQMGGPAFVVKMIDNFCGYVPQKVAEARAAERAGALDNIRKAVHPIKSSAAHVGAQALQDVALRLEQTALARPLADSAVLLSQLETECERVMACLAERRRAYAPQASPSGR